MMAVNGYIDLIDIPQPLRRKLQAKPGCQYKDVMKTEFHVWKPEALCRGYLMLKAERKRLLQKDWLSCYITICANLVLLFKDCKQSTNKPLEYTTLSPGDTITVHVENDEKHKFCFAIETAHKDDRDWIFSASKADERTMWMAAFDAVFDFMKHGRIKKWSLKILEKEKPFIGGPPTGKDIENLTHDYTNISDEEIYSEDGGMYDPIQPVQQYPVEPVKQYFTDVEISKLAGNFGSRWKPFAREALRLSQSEIECIEGKNKYDLQEQMVAALQLWQRKEKKENRNTRAKLIALLESSSYCDPEALLCLENPDSYDYLQVKSKKGHTEEWTSHTYDIVGPSKQSIPRPPLYSRTLYATISPNQVTGKALTSDGQFPVKKDTQSEKCNTRPRSSCGPVNKNWEVINAEMKQKMKKRSTLYE